MLSIYLIVGLGAVVAGFVQGLSGFAFGMVAMSFWAWVLDPKLAATLSVFGALTGQIIAAASTRRGWDFKQLLPFVAGGLVGIPIGMMLLPRLDMNLFKVCLGTMLVLWCPVMLMSAKLPKITAGGRVADGMAGVAGGVMGGLGGMSGTLPTLWCTLRGYEREAQRSVIQNFNLAMQFATMAAYMASGMVTKTTLPMMAIVLPAVFIPVVLGNKLYLGISDERFRQIVLTLLTMSGVFMLVSSVPKLLH